MKPKQFFIAILSLCTLVFWMGFRWGSITTVVEERPFPAAISQAVARLAVGAWVNQLATQRNITTAQGKRDSIERSVFFSKSELQSILNHLGTGSNTGVRLYFGYFDGSNQDVRSYVLDNGGDSTLLNRNSIILMGTDSSGVPGQNPVLMNLGKTCPLQCPESFSDPLYPES